MGERQSKFKKNTQMKKYIILVLSIAFQFHLVQAGIVVHNGLSHFFQVENGKNYKGKIVLENTGKETSQVKIYLQDVSYRADGTINYDAPSTEKKRSNAGWMQLSTNLLTLKPGEKTDFLYEMNVPDQLAAKGSYWSVFIVEPVKDIKPNDKAGVSITSVIRYAILVVADIYSESAKVDLRFENVKIVKEDNNRILKVAIANTGELFCKPVAFIDIYDKKTGQKKGRFTDTAMGLLPDNSKYFSINIESLSPGLYNAVLMAIDENDNTFALKTDLEIGNEQTR